MRDDFSFTFANLLTLNFLLLLATWTFYPVSAEELLSNHLTIDNTDASYLERSNVQNLVYEQNINEGDLEPYSRANSEKEPESTLGRNAVFPLLHTDISLGCKPWQPNDPYPATYTSTSTAKSVNSASVDWWIMLKLPGGYESAYLDSEMLNSCLGKENKSKRSNHTSDTLSGDFRILPSFKKRFTNDANDNSFPLNCWRIGIDINSRGSPTRLTLDQLEENLSVPSKAANVDEGGSTQVDTGDSAASSKAGDMRKEFAHDFRNSAAFRKESHLPKSSSSSETLVFGDLDGVQENEEKGRKETGRARDAATLLGGRQSDAASSKAKVSSREGFLRLPGGPGTDSSSHSDATDPAGYVLYNDEDPLRREFWTRGHAKGVLGFRSNGGFWMTHSLPTFPGMPASPFFGLVQASQAVFGQHAFCITLPRNELLTVVEGLFTMRPHVYNGSIPSKRVLDLYRPVLRLFEGLRPNDDDDDQGDGVAEHRDDTTIYKKDREGETNGEGSENVADCLGQGSGIRESKVIAPSKMNNNFVLRRRRPDNVTSHAKVGRDFEATRKSESAVRERLTSVESSNKKDPQSSTRFKAITLSVIFEHLRNAWTYVFRKTPALLSLNPGTLKAAPHGASTAGRAPSATLLSSPSRSPSPPPPAPPAPSVKRKNVSFLAFHSAGGLVFTHIVKAASFNVKIHEQVVEPFLGTGMAWETWRIGPSFPSYCPLTPPPDPKSLSPSPSPSSPSPSSPSPSSSSSFFRRLQRTTTSARNGPRRSGGTAFLRDSFFPMSVRPGRVVSIGKENDTSILFPSLNIQEIEIRGINASDPRLPDRLRDILEDAGEEREAPGSQPGGFPLGVDLSKGGGKGGKGKSGGGSDPLDAASASFTSIRDHSKWGISLNPALPYVCIGDLNRQPGQVFRGGGFVCIRDAGFWAVWHSLLRKEDKC